MTSRDLSPRKARICKRDDCRRRSFGNLDWVCPEHGKSATEDQPDYPYFGIVPTQRRDTQ